MISGAILIREAFLNLILIKLTMLTLTAEHLNETFLSTKELYTFLQTQGGGFYLPKFARNITTKNYLLNYIGTNKEFFRVKNSEIKPFSKEESKLKL